MRHVVLLNRFGGAHDTTAGRRWHPATVATPVAERPLLERAVRAQAAPLKLRILHLEEKLPNAHDLYLNFSGILEP